MCATENPMIDTTQHCSNFLVLVFQVVKCYVLQKIYSQRFQFFDSVAEFELQELRVKILQNEFQ